MINVRSNNWYQNKGHVFFHINLFINQIIFFISGFMGLDGWSIFFSLLLWYFMIFLVFLELWAFLERLFHCHDCTVGLVWENSSRFSFGSYKYGTPCYFFFLLLLLLFMFAFNSTVILLLLHFSSNFVSMYLVSLIETCHCTPTPVQYRNMLNFRRCMVIYLNLNVFLLEIAESRNLNLAFEICFRCAFWTVRICLYTSLYDLKSLTLLFNGS